MPRQAKVKPGMPDLIRCYYVAWLDHRNDEHHSDRYFYRFVWACRRYGNVRRSGGWLRQQLIADAVFTGDKLHDQQLQERVYLFDDLWDFLDAEREFPDIWIEGRKKVALQIDLMRYQNADGSRKYSDEDISRQADECIRRRKERLQKGNNLSS